MKHIFIILLLISNFAIAKVPKLDSLLTLPSVDVAQELAKDAQHSDKDQPLRYAVRAKVEDVFVHGTKTQGGQWNQLADGSWIWRILVNADNAKSLGFGLKDFFMPPTAELNFYEWTGDLAKGPYTDQKNKPHKQLWTGPIIGDVVTIELKVADKYKDHVSFTIDSVARGYKNIWQDIDVLPKDSSSMFWNDDEMSVKSGSCNVDVACPEGDDWRNQIRSVAQFVFSRDGSDFVCTGSMVNNAAENSRPLFLTANHCVPTNTVATTLNLWWNYESSQCREVGSSASGTPISRATFNDTQSGASLKATLASTDFTLLELDETPDASYNVFYSGWDVQDKVSSMAVGIHHPRGHAKRISFENDPTSITGWDGSSNTHLRVADWDLGTTEGGSSGSGLWNGNKLLIGQLSGGLAACGNDEWDAYGRLFTSWEGGGSANSRLKDWLDPNNTGVETLQGLGDDSCPNINVTINHESDSEEIGISQNFSATIKGGSPPYEYKWDINADEQTDGLDESITAVYSSQYSNNVTVSITDSDGCASIGTKAVVIQAPNISLLNSGETAQLCGNDDNVIDPGERWRVSANMQNNGSVSATNSYVVFQKMVAGASVDIVGNDNYGNGVGACARDFIDISKTGSELGFVDPNPDDTIPGNDDGAAIVELSQPFNFYGQTISSLSVSSNGYISIDSTDTGADFDNDCPLPTLPNNTANGSSTMARIIPLHDDLIPTQLFHQHFDICPRQSALGVDLACDIFMYTDVDVYDNSNSDIESFNFEAILYPAVSQWVFQYEGEGFRPESSSVGIQNNNASDGVSFSCNNASEINTTEAVCVYHKDFQGAGDIDATDVSFYNLETPYIATGDLTVSQNKNDFVHFSVAEDASCGANINITMQAAVYDTGFNQDGGSLLATTIGNDGVCNVVTNCDVSDANDINPTNGLWFNDKRSGNGNDMYFTDNGLIYLQYTALEDRSPIWYITGANDYYQNNQAYNELTKKSYNGPFLSSTQTTTKVGESLTTLIDANNAIQTRTINGEFSAELIKSFIFSNNPVTAQRTGLWYNPSEAGWGQTVGTQGDVEVIINYLYDNTGQPYWLLGSGENTAVADIDMLYYNAFCPHCPSTTVTSKVVGSVRIDYDDNNTTATIQSMQVDIEGEHAGQWNRENLPLNLLTPPLD
ncbi:MAG: hypothetical protein L3J53_08670 [Proteobacteria bacterium]|nr:hypothetical protein [Pseudomonadota bacterium]